MEVWLRAADMPKNCERCIFTNRDDFCILQSEEENLAAETWADLEKTCPLRYLPEPRAATT